MQVLRNRKGPSVEDATTVVEHEGAKYKVPSWVKFLTREKGSPYVIGWDEEPMLCEEKWHLSSEHSRWTYAIRIDPTTSFFFKIDG